MARTLTWLAACVVAVLLPTPGFAGAITADHQCMGPWVGRGQNSNSSTFWTIDLNLTAAPDGGRCGTIRYTTPDCHGFLDSCRLVGQDIHTTENYTHRGECAPPGRVIIRCEGDQMRYSWIGWEQVDTTLRRPAGYQPPRPASGTAPTPLPAPSTTLPAPPPPAPRAEAEPGVLGGGTPPAPIVPATPPPAPPTSGFNCLPTCAVAAARPANAGAAGLLFALLALLLVRRRP